MKRRLYNKIIHGTIAQTFKDGLCIGQEFSQTHETTYETQGRHVIEGGEIDIKNEQDFPTDLLQPDEVAVKKQVIENLKKYVQSYQTALRFMDKNGLIVPEIFRKVYTEMVVQLQELGCKDEWIYQPLL